MLLFLLPQIDDHGAQIEVKLLRIRMPGLSDFINYGVDLHG
ncbi:MAG: hypothetical protein O2923_06890 [Verrucomicrobia bacterium]|nr:hypothetical protein [Verrucomicrobiota bacterium]MDA1087727.1 hypothetical protein [Verrucomicrobiota bacterium]